MLWPAPGFLPMYQSSPCQLNPMGSGQQKKSWTRSVFCHQQRKGLEEIFKVKKYLTKPERKQLAAKVGLTDHQVSLKSE